jgi:hypothetical protein
MLGLVSRWFYEPNVSRDYRQARLIALGAVCAALVVVFVNPFAMSKAASNDYRNLPDQGGAAEFNRSLNPGPGELLTVVVDQYDKGQIYIIGSGENFVGGSGSRPRGTGIYEVLEFDRVRSALRWARSRDESPEAKVRMWVSARPPAVAGILWGTT